MSEELKPCPFCGKGAAAAFEQMVSTDADFWWIECGNPKCNANICGQGLDDAIVRWNSRAHLSGISDPAEFMASVRELVEAIRQEYSLTGHEEPEDFIFHREKVRTALAAVEAQKGAKP